MMVSPFTFYRGAAKIMAPDVTGNPPSAGRDIPLQVKISTQVLDLPLDRRR
jgi:hypothetical protein